MPEYIKDIRKRINGSISKSFSKHYGQENEQDFKFEGKNILGREIIKNYVLKILEYDENYSPFDILGLEKKYTYDFPLQIHGKEVKIGLKGIIDRIDRKDGSVRIVDYKSGRDESSFKNIQGLFDKSDDQRNKAVFQTCFYAFLFSMNRPELAGGTVKVGLYNLKELYNTDFDVRLKLKSLGNSIFIDDIMPFLDEYKQHLKDLILEIFNTDLPFKHEDDKDKCVYCNRLGMPSDFE
jgi:hypothetical protein